MRSFFFARAFGISVLLMLLAVVSGAARAGAYEATLPPDLHTAPNLCARVPCGDVFPGATSFSDRKGQPPYVEAYRGEGASRTLLGYVMLSTDITDTPAYSGKPVVTLIGMDTQGHYVGLKVIKHSEPILLLGIPEAALTQFNAQYIGKSVNQKIEVGHARPEAQVLGVDAISGATVTVIAQNQVIHESAAAVARQVGILKSQPRAPARYVELHRAWTWPELVSEGAVTRLAVTTQQVGLSASATPFIELWFGDLNHPDIGRSILGADGWDNLRSRLKPGEHAIFVIRTQGSESFKGSGFVRGGIYDRIQLHQGMDSFTFRDLDYLNLYGVQAVGAPSYTESAIFIIRSPSFSAAYPWNLAYLGNRVDRATGVRTFANFDAEYWLPAETLQGGRPAVAQPTEAWRQVWQARATEIALFALLLCAVATVYACRDALTRRASRQNKWPVNVFKYGAWIIAITWVGFSAMAQPSITQVLTWFHAILFQWRWALFLSDPFIFLFWIFIIVTVFIWGRGLFCGWLCPFGSLSELLFKVAGVCGLRRFQFQLPPVWHQRLKWLKYGVFGALLAVSMVSMTAAEMLAEVEPFKTTFLVGPLQRAWPYTLFVAVVLGLSLFTERPYCKYLCPLGASLAMPSTFRWFGLRRKMDCNRCKACAVGCGAQAIDADGRIDHRECLHCLDCMVLYTDTHACPPLAKGRKACEREGLPVPPIGRDGYFIPIHPDYAAIRSLAGRHEAHAGKQIDPRMPTDPIDAAVWGGKAQPSWWREWVDHIWPWVTWQQAGIVGVLLVTVVSVVWALTAAGKVMSMGAIVVWFAWSVFEVLIRLRYKRYVKDGPWWQQRFRRATVMDLLSYVGFKNLLIGAAVFLLLRATGHWIG